MAAQLETVAGPVTPLPGCVLTVLQPHRAVVWLVGEIDIALTADLRDIADHIFDTGTTTLVVDGSRLRFCDATLATFLAAALRHGTVTIRRPPKLLTDYLTIVGLHDAVKIDSRNSTSDP
jgi:hypothetical protein